DTEQEEIEEISPVYEDSFLEGGREYKDSKLQEKTQKQLVKKKRKEIRNEVKILLQSAKFDKFPINYTKKFSKIVPQLERELIPHIRIILEQ
ncbi:17412_t:CDS:2, partial [Funneliformis caledonium]